MSKHMINGKYYETHGKAPVIHKYFLKIRL